MNLRNIAIIAHVDHGKTTLVDALFRHSGVVRANQKVADRALDSNDQERERGITILAKCTSVPWGETRINIVDTPGHADFGGEVERVLDMVDGALLLVDAAEGPMPQTKFVTAKALKLGLKPIVVINKIDRADARPDQVLEEIFDLFVALEASDDQLDFPVLYASGREGWAVAEADQAPGRDLTPLLAAIVGHVPPPEVEPDQPFTLMASMLDYDPFLGRVLTGRIRSGAILTNSWIKALGHDGREVARIRVTKLLAYRGLGRQAVERGEAGDIIAIAGIDKASVADTLCDLAVDRPIAAQPIDPPTLAVTFSINDSPLAGRDGAKVQSRVIRERLARESEGNVAIEVSETGDKDTFEVAGRGELQLGVLIETMRREGFELSVSRPRVLYREDPETGRRLEPIEEVQIDLDEDYAGTVMEKLSLRKAKLTDLRPAGAGKTRLTFLCPSRGLIGYHGEFLTDTRGTGVMYRLFHGYQPYAGPIPGRRQGVLIANAAGKSVAYALWHLEERGRLFIGRGEQVYQGMIIGEHTRPNDLDVNPLKTKQLTNIRASGTDEAVRLTPPTRLTLEQAIAYIADDELVEVTPKHIRLRKRHLDRHARKRAVREAEAG